MSVWLAMLLKRMCVREKSKKKCVEIDDGENYAFLR